MKVYLGGPMTGLPGHNFTNFDRGAAVLRALGVEVLAAHEVDFGETEVNRGKTREYMDYIRGDLKVLLECEAVVFLQGWRASKGCKIEHTVASLLGMRVYDLIFGEGEIKTYVRDVYTNEIVLPKLPEVVWKPGK